MLTQGQGDGDGMSATAAPEPVASAMATATAAAAAATLGARALAAAARLPDRVLRWGLTGLAVAVLVADRVLLLRADRPVQAGFESSASSASRSTTTGTSPKDIYGAWPLVIGTLITSAIALVIGVPIAVGDGDLPLTELCPRRARAAADGPRRAARGGPVGRLRAVGCLRADPQAQAGGAVVLGHVLLPAVRRRDGRRARTTSSPG